MLYLVVSVLQTIKSINVTSNPLLSRKIQKVAGTLFLAWIIAFVLLFYYTLNFSWPVSAGDSLISNALLAAACLAISMVLRFYQPKHDIVLFVIVMAVALAIAICLVSKFMLTNIFHNQQTYTEFLSFSIPFRFIVLFVFLAWCGLANVLWYRLEEQSEMQERLFTAQNLAKEAELNKLRHQLQPHFLFNSLNSVYALTIVNPKEAGTMITKLASFLRGTLKRDDEVWVSVAEEME